MEKMKVMTILGTRPEIIRLSEVIKCCDKYFNHILVHTGQNWDTTLNDVFFSDLNLRQPDYYLDAVGSNLGAVSYTHLVQDLITTPKSFASSHACNAVTTAPRSSLPSRRIPSMSLLVRSTSLSGV